MTNVTDSLKICYNLIVILSLRIPREYSKLVIGLGVEATKFNDITDTEKFNEYNHEAFLVYLRLSLNDQIVPGSIKRFLKSQTFKVF